MKMRSIAMPGAGKYDPYFFRYNLYYSGDEMNGSYKPAVSE
jgi:hypothetical protein